MAYFFVSGVHASGVIDEISVTATREKNSVGQSVTILDKQSLNTRYPSVFTDVLRSLSGVGLRTNSRGEAVLRIRGSEERQSQVFLNGAPLSVPWDGRLDLSLLPSGILDTVRIIRSVAPLEYGANAVLSVVDVTTKKSSENIILEGRIEIGSIGKYLVDGRKFQQWYNLKGSYGYGFEGAFVWNVTKRLNIESSFSQQTLKAKLELNEVRPLLFQCPGWQGLLAANLSLPEKFNVRAEISHTGSAKDQNEDGTIVDLGTSTEINLRTSYKMQQRWEVYGAIDNLSNTVVLPQLGLPLPGSSIKVGVIFRGL